MKSRPVLGLTMGDPAGIGPEICLRALREPAVLKQSVPVLFGDSGVIHKLLSHPSYRSHSLKRQKGTRATKPPCRIITLQEWNSLGVPSEPLMVDCATVNPGRVRPGKVSPACGRAAYTYIEHAVAASLAKQIDGVITAPIHKEALHLADIKHPGHTEIFTALTGAKRSCMMLHADALTVSMATTHIGYRDVPGRLSAARVLDVIELTAQTMSRLLRRQPRIGVCGLNPHAGEHGLFGQREEERFVLPAVTRARKRGINAEGPLVPDAVFTSGQRKLYDAIVTLYHDQGHIPFKMLAFDTGVNITLGLPIIRTSVDHGTAFDIAWQGKADAQSMFAAIRVAAQMAAGKLL